MSPQNCDMGTKQTTDNGHKPTAKPEALERVLAGKCLSCEDNPPEKRGLCHKCYQQAGRGIKSGETTEEELIFLGFMLPDGQFGYGRKPKGKSRILDLLKEKKAAAVAPLAEEAMTREKARMKRRK